MDRARKTVSLSFNLFRSLSLSAFLKEMQAKNSFNLLYLLKTSQERMAEGREHWGRIRHLLITGLRGKTHELWGRSIF